MEARQARRLRDNLDIAGMAHNDWMFGLADTGAMTAERVRHYLEQIPGRRIRALFPSGDGAAFGLASELSLC